MIAAITQAQVIRNIFCYLKLAAIRGRLPRRVLAKHRSMGLPNRSSAHDVARGLLGRVHATEVNLVTRRRL
jgi:hypothetical protein